MFIQMPVKVVQNNSLGSITLSQNSRSRRIRLSIKAGQRILVSFPAHVTFREAEKFAEQHKEWIIKQKDKLKPLLLPVSHETPLCTNYHQVNFRSHDGPYKLVRKENNFILYHPAHIPLEDAAAREPVLTLLTEVFRWEAKKYLLPRAAELAEIHGFRVNAFRIRDNKTLWGSCSAKNNISLNLHLMRLPGYLADFIVLHELVHTKIKNHGPRFWEMLNRVTGNQARELAHEIRNYSIIH